MARMSYYISSLSNITDVVSQPLWLAGVDASEVASTGTFWTTNAVLTCLWICLFYFLCWHWRNRGAQRYGPSSKDHENDVYWCARNLIGIYMAAIISLIAVPVGLDFLFNPEAKFCRSPNVGTCYAQEGLCNTYNLSGMSIAFAGQLFVTFTFADTIISLSHKLATPDFVVHHAAFLTAGFIVRSNCMLPFNASVLLAMEVSTPSLNYMLLVRHRGDAYKTAVQIHGSIFFVLFVLFRLLLNTYGTYVLIAERDTALPEDLPAWQKWFLIVAILAGAVLQFFWFVSAIAGKFGSQFIKLCKNRYNNGRWTTNGAKDGDYSQMKP